MKRQLFLQSFFLFAIGIAAIIYFQSLTVPEKFACPEKNVASKNALKVMRETAARTFCTIL